MCLITEHAQALRRIKELEGINTEYQRLLNEATGFKPTVDIPSPRDIIDQRDIEFDEIKQRITIDNIMPPIWLTTVADTNSMDGTVDMGHTCILTGHFNHADLKIGDVVVYDVGLGFTVLHRIIDIKEDEQGRKYTTKGDNNHQADGYELRDAHIKWLLIGIIY